MCTLAARGTFPRTFGVYLQVKSRTAGTSPFYCSLLTPVYTLISLHVPTLKVYSHVLLYQLSMRCIITYLHWHALISHSCSKRVSSADSRTLCIEM